MAGKQSELIASELSAMMLELADLDARIGPENSTMMEVGHRNHARFLSSVLVSVVPQPSLNRNACSST